MTYVLTAWLGLIMGSFLNVVVARLPAGRSVVKPGSACPDCNTPISWYDNIPIVSYLWLRGKSRCCKKTISPRYPLIEFLTALLFIAARVKYGWSPLLLLRDFPFIMLLVSITFIDLEHRIIPDKLSLSGLVLGLATGWAVPELGWLSSLSGAALGFGIFYFFSWLYLRITGRVGLGGGDIKLLAMLGAFLGPAGVFATILISSVSGSVLGIGWGLIVGKKEMMRTAIPYGPFLVLGGLYYYLLGDTLWLQFMIPT